MVDCPICNLPMSKDRNMNIWHMVAAHPDIQLAGALLDITKVLESKGKEKEKNNDR